MLQEYEASELLSARMAACCEMHIPLGWRTRLRRFLRRMLHLPSAQPRRLPKHATQTPSAIVYCNPRLPNYWRP